MASTYPTGIVTFPVLADYTSIAYAGDVSAGYAEIVAIQTALGPAANTLHAPSHTPNTVASILDALDTGKAAASHTHSVFTGSTTIGGSSTVANININGNNIQALNGVTKSVLTLQPNDGDVHIGDGDVQVTVYGGLAASTLTGASARIGSLTVTDNAAIAGQLNITGNISAAGEMVVTQVNASVVVCPEIKIPSTGGQFDLGNGETIHPSGANVTVLDGDQTVSVKRVVGQLVPSKARLFGNFTYSQASLMVTRPAGDSRSDLSFYSSYSGGSALIIYIDATEGNLGLQVEQGAGPAPAGGYAPVTASGFITASSAATKTNIEDYAPGKVLKRLRPVSFNRSLSLHTPSTENETGVPVALQGKAKAAYLKAHPPTPSVGDEKRFSTKHLGLIAEEVYSVVPEVVHLDADGKPAGIDYGALTAVLIGHIQDLTARLEALENPNA